jgi:two-component system, OmpR family, sensor kinase
MAMNTSRKEEYNLERQNELLTGLERLLELPTSGMRFMFDQAIQQVQEVLGADMVAFFFHDSATDSLIALHSSDTPMGRRLYSRGINRLPLVSGGSAVEVFLSGAPFITGEAERIASESRGIITGLGVKSQVAAVFRVRTQHRGVVVAASARSNFFSVNDLHFLEGIARWVGLVVGRSELTGQMQGFSEDQQERTEELLTIMIHELRNYLQPLRGRMDLLLERAKREGREKDSRDAESGLHTLALLTRGIADAVDIARLNQGMFAITPVSINLKMVAQEVVSVWVDRNVPIALHMPAEVIVVADPQRIQQALETMVDYTLSSGLTVAEVVIGSSTEKRGDEHWVSLSVMGVGVGYNSVAESLLSNFASKVHSNQLDVQLYLTNQIALAHHGTFSIDATNVQGCKLTLAFPVEEEELIVRGEDEFRMIL